MVTRNQRWRKGLWSQYPIDLAFFHYILSTRCAPTHFQNPPFLVVPHNLGAFRTDPRLNHYRATKKSKVSSVREASPSKSLSLTKKNLKVWWNWASLSF